MTSPSDISNDTICAISTPAGVGGIAVVRVSGSEARQIVDRLWRGKHSLVDAKSHRAYFGNLIDPERNNELLDEAVATLFIAPHSFTGEDTVELSVHGSRYIQNRLLQLLIVNGARLAEPGEFTRRAFANGKMDLSQAEAVADVIAADSRAAHRLAASQLKGSFSRRLEQLREQLLTMASLLELELDFSEEEVEFASRTQLRQLAQEIHNEVSRLHRSFAAGEAIKEGIPVAIIGPTNAGKSSLLNALLGEERAIVSDIHGTTRDTIEETLHLGDYTFRFIDTAGLRETSDPIEALGIDRSRAAAARAAIILSLTPAIPLPPLQGEAESEATHTKFQLPLRGEAEAITIPVSSKIDLLSAQEPENLLPNSQQPLLQIETEAPNSLSQRPPLQSETEGFNSPSQRPRSEAKPKLLNSPLAISSKTGQGLPALRARLIAIADQLRGNADEDTPIVTNLRHAQALAAAATSTRAILDALATNLPGDLIAQDLRATIHHLSTITGTLTTPDILATIFSRFCIGK